jgi:hypothetical protein
MYLVYIGNNNMGKEVQVQTHLCTVPSCEGKKGPGSNENRLICVIKSSSLFFLSAPKFHLV